MEEEIKREIRKKIMLSAIGSGTIEKQFFDYYDAKNPCATVDDVVEAYHRFVGELGRLYNVGYGSTMLVRILSEEYYVNITIKTLLSWLREHGVAIRLPTRERVRVPSTQWERERIYEIKMLQEGADFSKKQHDSTIDELMMCRSALRMCDREKRSLTEKFEECRKERLELIISAPAVMENPVPI